MTYALIVHSRECQSSTSRIMTVENEPFWVLNEPEGWVEATSTRCKDRNKIPLSIKTFGTTGAAERFAKRWKGHPWYCDPNGTFEVVKVKPSYRRVLSGYTVASS